MSVRVMAMVYGACIGQAMVQAIRIGAVYRKAGLLKLADVADEDGGSIRVSVARLARETEMSERHARYVIRSLERDGLLSTDVDGGQGPGSAAHRRLNLDALAALPRTMGASIAPLLRPRGQYGTQKGAILAGNPSVTHQGLIPHNPPAGGTDRSRGKESRTQPGGGAGARGQGSADGASGDRVPITVEIVREAQALGVELEPIYERYLRQARRGVIRDPAAYMLKSIRDAAAKRDGVPVAALSGPNRRQPRQAAVAAGDAVGAALSRLGASRLARSRR